MPENNLEFTRSLYERTIDWYKNADAKAQIILTLNGAFVTFLTSSLFRAPEELVKVTTKFSSFTWFCLFSMCVCILGSIAGALVCLWSRIPFAKRAAAENAGEALLDEIAFFGTVRSLAFRDFQRQLPEMTEAAELKALGKQIHLLSQNVYDKHLAVNLGFLLIGGTLIFFLLGGIGYVSNVR